MSRKILYREYDEEGNLIKLECSHCGEIKSVDNFSKCKSKKDGYSNTCKLCMNEYMNQHKEERKEYLSNYSKNHKEELKEYQRQRYKNHKKDIKGKSKQHYHNNKETKKDYQRKYSENHKEEIKEYRQQYQEKRVNREIIKIYEIITQNLHKKKGIQYGAIYWVHCIPTDRWYIGQTIRSFNIRYHGKFFQNKIYKLIGSKGKLLQDDIGKYGQENFEIFEVLDVAFSEKELDEKEVYYIDLYKAYDEGYNSNRGNIFKYNKSKRKEVI